MHAEVQRCLDDPDTKLRRRFGTTDSDHGRIEVLRHVVSYEVDWLTTDCCVPSEPRFPGLAAIAMVESEIERNGSTSRERRYYPSSKLLDAKLFAHAVRCHWHVENRLHWVLDIVFHEDLSGFALAPGRRTWPPSPHGHELAAYLQQQA